MCFKKCVLLQFLVSGKIIEDSNRKVDNIMDRQSFTDLIQTKFKMVRIEAGYTQDTMAQTIGLSKDISSN